MSIYVSDGISVFSSVGVGISDSVRDCVSGVMLVMEWVWFFRKQFIQLLFDSVFFVSECLQVSQVC